MTREELIQEMIEKFGNGCTVPIVFRTNIPEVADFILSREKALLEKIWKPLREAIVAYPNHECMGCRAFVRKIVDSALAIIEKEGI